ncbi:MAG TPA: esterase-like activity of phytase family protein [Thermomicrobiales bacterium]|jgi:hypothetical protein|nr:esterase-like activity of phytase family protein [Thermomicrobiales bacterium]
MLNRRHLAIPVTAAMLSAVVALPAIVPAQDTPVERSVGTLSLIGEQQLANDLLVDDTLVGGLSGLDYDPETDSWIVLSDDRSDEAPARFYDATLTYDGTSFESVELTSAVTLLQEDGSPFPNSEAGGNVPDPESIRFDPESGNYFWTSEGSQELGIDPGVYITAPDGTFVAQQPIDDIFAANTAGETGIRDNGSFEGMTFSADGQSYFVSTEAPLFQDGPAPDGTAGGVHRITEYDRDGNVLAQYAYESDAVPNVPADALFSTNGITEILAVSDTTMLLLERGTVQQADETYVNNVRLYLVDLSGATDISGIDALVNADYTPAAKTLVEEFDGSNFTVDNLETLAWGPELESGNPSLVIGSDNNFNDSQVTQFLVFEVLPEGTGATPGTTPAGTPVSATPEVEIGTGQDQDIDQVTPEATPELDATPTTGTPEVEVGTGQDQDIDQVTPEASPSV